MSDDIIIEYDRQGAGTENGIVVPYDRIQPGTLLRLVEEFVTREWSDLTDGSCTLEVKIAQVLRQLQVGTVVVVFDTISETCNIAPAADATASIS